MGPLLTSIPAALDHLFRTFLVNWIFKTLIGMLQMLKVADHANIRIAVGQQQDIQTSLCRGSSGQGCSSGYWLPRQNRNEAAWARGRADRRSRFRIRLLQRLDRNRLEKP